MNHKKPVVREHYRRVFRFISAMEGINKKRIVNCLFFNLKTKQSYVFKTNVPFTF